MIYTDVLIQLPVLEQLAKHLKLKDFSALSSTCFALNEALSKSHCLIHYDVFVNTHGESSLERACAIGNVHLVHMLLEADYIYCTYDLLYIALENNHLCVFQYLMEQSQYREVRSRDYGLLESACEIGHMSFVRYLHEKCNLSRDDFRKNDSSPLRLACRGGHLEIVKYLYDNLIFGKDDIMHEFGPVWCACANGQIKVVKFLHNIIRNAMCKFKPYMANVAYVTCKNGHMEVLKYIHDKMGATPDDFRNWSLSSLEIACKCGWYNIVTYLHSIVGLDKSDFCRYGCRTLQFAHFNDDAKTISYIIDVVGLTKNDIVENCLDSFRCEQLIRLFPVNCQ